MAEIIKIETEDDHTKARQTLLLHASKGDIGMMMAAQLFMSISQMQVIQEENARMNIWKDLGLKLIAHKEVSQATTRNNLSKIKFFPINQTNELL